MGNDRIPCLFKFIFEPSSLLLEDQGSETRSKEHDQTVVVFVKLVSRKLMNTSVYVALYIS